MDFSRRSAPAGVRARKLVEIDPAATPELLRWASESGAQPEAGRSQSGPGRKLETVLLPRGEIRPGDFPVAPEDAAAELNRILRDPFEWPRVVRDLPACGAAAVWLPQRHMDVREMTAALTGACIRGDLVLARRGAAPAGNAAPSEAVRNTIAVVPREELDPADNIVPPHYSAANAARILANEGTRAAVVDLLRRLPGASGIGAGSGEAALRSAFEHALRTGSLCLVAATVAACAGGGSGQVENLPQPKAASSRPEAAKVPPPRPQQPKTYIEIRLVDETGNPVGGAKYKLQLTDGSVREGNLDADGWVRVRGIDPGTCKVTFPEMWKIGVPAEEVKRSR